MSTTREHAGPGGAAAQPAPPGCEPLLAPVARLEDVTPVHREIRSCLYCGNEVRAFALLSWLMLSATSLPRETYGVAIGVFRNSVGDLALPIVSATVTAHRHILEWMLESADVQQDASLLNRAKNVAYRLHEAHGEYARARALLRDLIEVSSAAGNRPRCAHFTNNLAYEFLLEGDYRSALPHFRRALQWYAGLDAKVQIANVEANLLTCEFALAPCGGWEALLPRLHKTHRRLRSAGDWRMRKTMRLLALQAEARGRHAAALGWARRALAQTRGKATGLRGIDQRFLDSLQCRRPRPAGR